jgi:CheY-like chemotaxis protein
MASNRGQLLFILASRDLQDAVQLAAAGALSPTETALQLKYLVDRGFVVASDGLDGVAVYHLRPEREWADELDRTRRLLVVESDLLLGELVTVILEDEGYAVISTRAPADAVALLSHVTFDLVITDGFSRTAGAALVNTAELRAAAGITPVALFTAHKLEPASVQAAGFRDLIEKPFDLEALERQVRTLLT